MSFDGELPLPLVSLSGALGADGEISIPLLAVSGSCGMSGWISLPLLSIFGKTQDVIDGEVLLYGLQFDGEIGVSARIDSDVTLPMLSITGGMQADGEIRVHLLSISGTMQHEGRVSGALSLPRVAVSGEVTVPAWMSGEIRLPLLVASGEIAASATSITVAVELPMLNILGSMALAASHDFGTETDSTLRYASSRRRI